MVDVWSARFRNPELRRESKTCSTRRRLIRCHRSKRKIYWPFAAQAVPGLQSMRDRVPCPMTTRHEEATVSIQGCRAECRRPQIGADAIHPARNYELRPVRDLLRRRTRKRGQTRARPHEMRSNSVSALDCISLRRVSAFKQASARVLRKS